MTAVQTITLNCDFPGCRKELTHRTESASKARRSVEASAALLRLASAWKVGVRDQRHVGLCSTTALRTRHYE